jgi:hypothetical protein
MRDGTFRDVAAEVGLAGSELKGATNVAAGDVNKDGFTDFYFGFATRAVISRSATAKSDFKSRKSRAAARVTVSRLRQRRSARSRHVARDNFGYFVTLADSG